MKPRIIQFQVVQAGGEVQLLVLYDNGALLCRDAADESDKWKAVQLLDPTLVAKVPDQMPFAKP